MPTYDYACDACGHQLEVFQSMRDNPLTDCPECGKPELRRLLGMGAGILFKGSGFYETDYKKKSGGGGGDSAPADSGSGKSGSEAPKASETGGKSDSSGSKAASSDSGSSGSK